MSRRLFRAAVVVILPLLAAAARAAPQWHTLQAPHCLIVSQLSERETRVWATQFEQFTAALRDVILIEDRFLPPLTVVLFADSGTFAPYRPLAANGKKRDVAGFFSSRDTWGVIGLAESFNDEATRHIVLHETTHWLVSATPSQTPLWLNEGFAEVFSSFEAKKDHGLLGQPIPYHVEALRNESWVPLFQLMLTGPNDRLYTDNNRNRVFYAESWLFVHRLLFHDRAAGYTALNRFFTARVRGVDQLTAFETAFGTNTSAADSQLEDYLHHGKFSLSRLPFPQSAKVTAPFESAAPLLVETALARLALTTDRNTLARTHLDRARSLAPSSSIPYELLAMLEYQSNNRDAATAAARQALDRKTNDAWMHILVARETWRVQADRGTLDTSAREIADRYAQAIALQPKLRTAYTEFAQVTQSLPAVTQEDAALLASGFKIFPDAAELLIGIAVVLHKGHNQAEAQSILDLALSRPEQLNQDQQANAARLCTEWKIEPLVRELDELVKQRNFPPAIAVCETILKEPMQLTQRRFWEGRCKELRFQDSLYSAQRTAEEGDLRSAVNILETLSAQPELTQLQLTHARRFLEQLRRQLPDP